MTMGTGAASPTPVARMAVLRVLAVFTAVLAFTMLAAGAAFANGGDIFARGVDYTGTGSAMKATADMIEEGNVEVAEVSGAAGDKVFVTVKQGERVIAKNLAHTLGSDLDESADGAVYGLIALDIAGFDAKDLQDGGYTVELYSSRTAKDAFYTGKLYGVYAKGLPGDDLQLIGTRTVSESEKDRAFNPPSTLLANGTTYSYTGTQDSSEPYIYVYEKRSADAVKGVVRYVYTADDGTQTEIQRDEYDVAEGGTQEVEIPATVQDGNNVYLTLPMVNPVVLSNPGALNHTVHCVPSKAQKYDYTATVSMVGDDGVTLATDKVTVRGDYTYTAPLYIYRDGEDEDGAPAVITYKRDAADGVVSLSTEAVRNDSTHTVTVTYTKQPVDSAEVTVTFNLLDGTKEPSANGRTLKVQTDTVDKKDTTAEPPASVTASGKTYNIAGSTSDYAYKYRSGAMPVVDVYYVPEGYQPDGPYTVSVRHVNYATNEVIKTTTFTSSPEDKSAVAIKTEKEFKTGSDTYVRLAGQTNIQHSYYSGLRTYTVYYRNAKDNLTSGVVRVRTVYDNPTTTTTTTGNGNAAPTAPAGTGTGAANAQLNQNGTYTTIGGDNATGTLRNEQGTDSTTERITDDTTPLAQYESQQAQGEQAGGVDPALVAGICAALAAAAGIIVFLARKRKDDDEAQA